MATGNHRYTNAPKMAEGPKSTGGASPAKPGIRGFTDEHQMARHRETDLVLLEPIVEVCRRLQQNLDGGEWKQYLGSEPGRRVQRWIE
jgi:hypothetical protein